MRIYVRKFKFYESPIFHDKFYIKYDLFDGLKWKHRKLLISNKNIGMEINFYTNIIHEDAVKLIVGDDKDTNQRSNLYQHRIFVLEQLNSSLFDKATKLFR